MTRASASVALTLIMAAGTLLQGCDIRETAATAAGSPAAAAADPYIDARPLELLEAISPAIPVYPGIRYEVDLTRQDNLNAERMYGPESQVWTFATPSSFPKVWHYYVAWLGMFRAYDAPASIPRSSASWRSLQINLNEAMQEPFVPGDEIEPGAHRVILEVAETDTRARTIIRYIITPNAGPDPAAVDPAPEAQETETAGPAAPGD